MSQKLKRIKNAVKFKSGESTSSKKVQSWTVRDSRPCRNRMTNNYATGTFTGLRSSRFGRGLTEPIFSGAGLEILSTSYAGRPGKLALKGNFLGAVRNIRVKISNRTLCSRKNRFSHPSKVATLSRIKASGKRNYYASVPAGLSAAGLVMVIGTAMCGGVMFGAEDTHAINLSFVDDVTTQSINIPPTADGKFVASNPITAKVVSDHASGYVLTVYSSALTDGTNTISPLNSGTSIDADAFSANNDDGKKYNNMWGYLPATYYNGTTTVTNNTDYFPAPIGKDNVATLDSTTGKTTAEGTTYAVSIGARIDNTAAQGSYESTFTFAVVGNVTPYSITYNDPSGEATGMPTPNPLTGNADEETTTVDLSSTAPTREGYEFKGWCSASTSDDTCSGATYNPDGGGTNLAFPLDFTNNNNNYTIYAMWEAESGSDLYSIVASKVKKNGNAEVTQSLSDMQAVITTENSGVYKYDASTFGAASDASNDYDIYYYRGILDRSFASSDPNGGYGSAGDGATWPNYVILDADGTKTTTDTCWRIVRTTGSGGVKMIYNGNWTGSTCANATTTAQITLNSTNTFYFNRPSTYASTSSCTSSNAYCGTLGFVTYVGYNYNSTYGYNNTSYTSAINNSTLFNNGTASNIKTQIETWYTSAIGSSSGHDYTSRLETSAGYCNDRTTYTSKTASASPSTTTVPYKKTSAGVVYFGANHRNVVAGNKLSLTCPNTTGYDLLTTSNGLGKPVALLTEDEVALAGNGYYTSAPTSTSTYSSNWAYNSFLRSGSDFWLLSPSYRTSDGVVHELFLYSNGPSSNLNVFLAYGVRPAISLKSGTTAASGSGTAADPWVVNP